MFSRDSNLRISKLKWNNKTVSCSSCFYLHFTIYIQIVDERKSIFREFQIINVEEIVELNWNITKKHKKLLWNGGSRQHHQGKIKLLGGRLMEDFYHEWNWQMKTGSTDQFHIKWHKTYKYKNKTSRNYITQCKRR